MVKLIVMIINLLKYDSFNEKNSNYFQKNDFFVISVQIMLINFIYQSTNIYVIYYMTLNSI